MPLYEYVCQQCGKRFEELQRLGATGDGLSCPSCGGAEVTRAFSTFAASSAPSGGGSSLPCGKSSSAGCGGGFT